MLGLNYTFEIAYYALEHCFKISPILLQYAYIKLCLECSIRVSSIRIFQHVMTVLLGCVDL